jgi:hypothetical protein
MLEDQAMTTEYFELFLSMQQYLHSLMLWTYATGGHEWEARTKHAIPQFPCQTNSIRSYSLRRWTRANAYVRRQCDKSRFKWYQITYRLWRQIGANVTGNGLHEKSMLQSWPFQIIKWYRSSYRLRRWVDANPTGSCLR